MGNTHVNKVLPAIDMLLVLVVVLFATAGLLRSVPPEGVDPNAYEALLAEQDRLDTEIKSKKAEAARFEQDLEDLESQDLPSPKTLETLLHAASGKQERIAESQLIVADMRDKLNDVKEVLQEKHQAVTLEKEIKRLKKEIERLEREKEVLERKVTEDDIEKGLVQALLGKLEEMKQDMERLKERLAELEKEAKEKADRPLWQGDHDGPYLLLECDDKGIVVYPGENRIVLDAPEYRIDRLKSEVKNVRGAVLVTRPSGFVEAHRKFYGILTGLAKEEAEKDEKIVLSFWPIAEDEPISHYMFKGGDQ